MSFIAKQGDLSVRRKGNFRNLPPMGKNEDKADPSRGSRIRALMEHYNLTQEGFAAALVSSGKVESITRGAVGNWIRGLGIKAEMLAAISDTFNVPLEWIAFGKDAPDWFLTTKTEPRRISIDEAESNGGDGDNRLLPEFGGWQELGPGDVPEVATRGQLGHGGLPAFQPVSTTNGITIAEDLIAAVWGIPDSFLSDLRATRGNLRILPVDGDSGYDPARPDLPGSFLPGDRVFVDVSDRTPSPPGPFAVWHGFGIVVKWVEADYPDILLKSRNPLYETRRRSLDEAKILGRVKGRITLF